MKRLEEFSKKFEVFFSEKDYDAVFSSEDLFGFDAARVSVVTKKVSADLPRDIDWINPEPSITLDT
jgi:hypothetical protein